MSLYQAVVSSEKSNVCDEKAALILQYYAFWVSYQIHKLVGFKLSL